MNEIDNEEKSLASKFAFCETVVEDSLGGKLEGDKKSVYSLFFRG